MSKTATPSRDAEGWPRSCLLIDLKGEDNCISKVPEAEAVFGCWRALRTGVFNLAALQKSGKSKLPVKLTGTPTNSGQCLPDKSKFL